jgi:hypothetical protein
VSSTSTALIKSNNPGKRGGKPVDDQRPLVDPKNPNPADMGFGTPPPRLEPQFGQHAPDADAIKPGVHFQSPDVQLTPRPS